MKVGDLVRLDPELYVREKDHVGQIIERAPSTSFLGSQWIVMIKDRIHPYHIAEEDMVVVNDNR